MEEFEQGPEPSSAGASPAPPPLPAELAPSLEERLNARLAQLEHETLSLGHQLQEASEGMAGLRSRVTLWQIVTLLLLLSFSGLAVWVTIRASEAQKPMPAPEYPVPEIRFAHWQQGDPPLKLIHSSRGYCYLTAIGGKFMGGAEVVKLTVGEGGYWYLSGHSNQESVAAECAIVEFPRNSHENPIPPSSRLSK